MKKLFKNIFYFTIFFLVNACSSNPEPMKPKNILSENQMRSLLKEMHLVDAASKQRFIKENRDITTKYALYKGVLEKNEISKEVFDSSMMFYSNHPEIFANIYDSMLIDLEKMKLEIQSIPKNDSIPQNKTDLTEQE